jgi:hypothetical protein
MSSKAKPRPGTEVPKLVGAGSGEAGSVSEDLIKVGVHAKRARLPRLLTGEMGDLWPLRERHLEDRRLEVIIKVPTQTQLSPTAIASHVESVLVSQGGVRMASQVLQCVLRYVFLPPSIEVDEEHTSVEIIPDSRELL